MLDLSIPPQLASQYKVLYINNKYNSYKIIYFTHSTVLVYLKYIYDIRTYSRSTVQTVVSQKKI